MQINVSVNDEVGLGDEVRAILQLVAHISGLVGCLKALGLTKDEAAERIGAAVRHAWDEE